LIELNRLSVPGEDAARERVEAVFAAVDRQSPEELFRQSIPYRSPEQRANLLAELAEVAERHGRSALLAEARDLVRNALLARATHRPVPTLATPGATLIGRAEDEVAVVTAIEDAVAVATVEDRLDPRTAHALADPGRVVLGLPPLAGSPVSPDAKPAGWEPSAADWTTAAGGKTAVDAGMSPPGTRAMRRLFFGVVAVTGAVAALAWGVADGSPWLGALVALAVVAVCWTFATFRSVR